MFLSLLLALTSPAAAESPPTGVFVRTTPDDVVERELKRAVDKAAEGVSWAFRGMARPRLAREATACDAYHFDSSTETFQVRCDKKDPFEWKIGERGTLKDPNGKPLTAEVLREGDNYTVILEGDRGGKKWLYLFGDSGSLKVTQEIFSPHLREPMRWTVDYRKR